MFSFFQNLHKKLKPLKKAVYKTFLSKRKKNYLK